MGARERTSPAHTEAIWLVEDNEVVTDDLPDEATPVLRIGMSRCPVVSDQPR